jgi:predicted permease
MLVTLLVSVGINLSGLGPHVPAFLTGMAHSLGVCAVPLGLLMTGVNLADYLDEPMKLLHRNVAIGACAVRLGIMPVLMLCLARWLPCSDDLKRVLVVQAAMPTAVFPIILSKYFGGQPLTAVQVVLSTTAVGLITCPFWIRAGLVWVGVP